MAPRSLEIKLPPPTPKRFVTAMRMNMIMYASDIAAIWNGSPVLPMKNASAMLYISVTSWLSTDGTTSFATAFGMGSDSNISCLSFASVAILS